MESCTGRMKKAYIWDWILLVRLTTNVCTDNDSQTTSISTATMQPYKTTFIQMRNLVLNVNQ